MTAVGSSKQISRSQIFWMVFLFQQSGVFWLLPYFLIHENGTIGLTALAAGVCTAAAILLAGRYWHNRIPDMGFVTALQQTNHFGGTLTGVLFLVFYLLFAVIMLYSFVDVTRQQLLEETPVLILCVVTVLLVGWMSQKGLESIARMHMLCIGALMLILAVSAAGTFDLFAVENALPIVVKNPEQLRRAALHSAVCYSGLLVVFMLYPAVDRRKPLGRILVPAVGLGALLIAIWTFYALCIMGEHSVQTILWIPVHLARMVQIRPLLEQPEALFVVLWMLQSVTSSSLVLWCASETLHQLFRRQNTWRLHWMMVLIVLIGMAAVHNSMRFLQMETILAMYVPVWLPVLLLLVVWLTPKRRKP